MRAVYSATADLAREVRDRIDGDRQTDSATLVEDLDEVAGHYRALADRFAEADRS